MPIDDIHPVPTSPRQLTYRHPFGYGITFEIIALMSSLLNWVMAAPKIQGEEDLPEKQKQWISNQDGIEKLKQEEVDVPKPKEGEVLVKVNAVSLNYRDTEGTYYCQL